MKPILKVDQLSFSYRMMNNTEGGPSWVLKEISFEIPPGEFLGVLGPNGSGKTTLIRLLAGALKPTRGGVDLFQRPLGQFSVKERARLMAVVPQELEVLFPFTTREVVLMGRWPYLKPFSWEGPQDDAAAEAAMRQTDCWRFASRPINEISGGEKERVLIARALAQEPKILLLDEPLTHLDLKHQVEIFQLLLRLNRENGLTLVMVLHDLNFAAAACRRILLLKNGNLVKWGDPREVMDQATIRDLFETEVLIGRNLETKRPYYLPLIHPDSWDEKNSPSS